MAAIPTPIHNTASMIYKAYENEADTGHRPHLGASIIGHHCERFLWLTFHWAKEKKFDGRMYRLFQRGKLEEKVICQDLRRIGCDVHEDDGGSQYRLSALGGHFGGSMDAVITGYHEAPKQWMPVEMKTHNAKSFKDLVEKRLKDSKPMHYAQLTTYQGLSGMDKSALYFAVNKDTDDIYVERIHFDKEEFDRLMARADRIIRANEPPLRCSNDPSWWQCRLCDMHQICHGTECCEVSCRSCAHSTPNITEGGWDCNMHGKANGTCKDHRFIPVLLERFAKVVDANEEHNWVKYENLINGKTFYNGDLSSEEIYRCADKSMLGEDRVQDLRHFLDAKIVA